MSSGDFTVVTISENRFSEVIDHLRLNFFADEPLNKAVGLCERGDSHYELEQHCLQTLKQGYSRMLVDQKGTVQALIMINFTNSIFQNVPMFIYLKEIEIQYENIRLLSAYLKNIDHTLNISLRTCIFSQIYLKRLNLSFQIAGAVLNGIVQKGDRQEAEKRLAEMSDEKFKTIFGLLYKVNEKIDLFSKYKVEDLFECRILNVDDRYRGRGLASILIEASLETARNNGFKVSLNISQNRTIILFYSL